MLVRHDGSCWCADINVDMVTADAEVGERSSPKPGSSAGWHCWSGGPAQTSQEAPSSADAP